MPNHLSWASGRQTILKPLIGVFDVGPLSPMGAVQTWPKRPLFGHFGGSRGLGDPPQPRFREGLLSLICYSPLGRSTGLALPWKDFEQSLWEAFFGGFSRIFFENRPKMPFSGIY